MAVRVGSAAFYIGAVALVFVDVQDTGDNRPDRDLVIQLFFE